MWRDSTAVAVVAFSATVKAFKKAENDNASDRREGESGLRKRMCW